jgi:glycosyltransferase involved in cell wall biosynthesis
MKSVWILNHYAQEPGGPGGTRHYSLARVLRQNGWQASLIAAGTEHGTGRERLAEGETRRLDHYDGVPFLWLRTAAYAGNGADRIKNMLGYTFAALKKENLTGLQRPDVVVGSSVHPFAAWAGLRLARRYRVPFVFEVRDLWPQTLVDLGRLSDSHPMTLALRWLERHLYKYASAIVVLLPRAGEYIEPLGVPADKIVWVPNGIELDIFPPPTPKAASDTFTLMYFGAHGTANGLDNVIKAMDEVRKKEPEKAISLRIIGDGPLKADLIKFAGELNLTNVSFEAPVPKKQIAQLASKADAFVFNLIDAPVFKYGISSNKLFDFMACGRPVIFSCDAGNNPVEAAAGGVTVPAGNPPALAQAIIDLADLPEDERQRMGAANRKHIEENYEFNLLGAKFAGALNRAVEKKQA